MIEAESTRIAIVVVGWLILFGGTGYLFVKERAIQRAVKGSMLARVVNAIMLTMFIGSYSLGFISTAFLYIDPEDAIYFVVPIFVVWFIMFTLVSRALISTAKEVRLTSG